MMQLMGRMTAGRQNLQAGICGRKILKKVLISCTVIYIVQHFFIQHYVLFAIFLLFVKFTRNF